MIVGIALGLAMDALAVTIGVSISLGGTSARQTFRLAWHFGLFQALMPLVGWFAGDAVRPFIEPWDHWLAFALLTLVGGRMLIGSDTHSPTEDRRRDPTRGWSLVVLSVATSIDALAVGFSFAALGVRIWLPSLIIGVTAGILTVLGAFVGQTLGRRFGHGVNLFGGLILIAIGCWIVFEHLA